MPHDENLEHAEAHSARGPCALYVLTLFALAGVLVAEFGVSYSLLRDHPGHAPGLTQEVYGMLVAGLLVLVAQGALVYAFLVRPLEEATLRREQLAMALDKSSHRDELTGILNRTAFDQMIVRELDALKRYGVNFCGIMVDVDGFRLINERLGYEQGDQALQDIATLLKQHMRKADFVFRWRSGRFLVLASGIDASQAQRFADKLRVLLASHGFRQGLQLTACLGVCQAQAQDTPEAFVGRVKAALARAKELGPSSVFTGSQPA